MQWTARSLIANEQGGPLLVLSVAPHQPPQCRTLTALVVHTTSVFFSRQKLEILYPFISMLTNPANLAVSCRMGRTRRPFRGSSSMYQNLMMDDFSFILECIPAHHGRRSPTRSKKGPWRSILWYMPMPKN